MLHEILLFIFYCRFLLLIRFVSFHFLSLFVTTLSLSLSKQKKLCIFQKHKTNKTNPVAAYAANIFLKSCGKNALLKN